VEQATQSDRVRFGVFEADLHRHELRKHGLKIKLQEKPFKILVLLLERPGEIITRDELREQLWADGTFVDFDRSLATALGKLRQALGDSGDNPRFIETVSRRGYRLIVPAVRLAPQETPPPQPTASRPWWAIFVPGIVAGLVVTMIAGWFVWHRSQKGGAVPVTTLRSIVVLPLDNLSSDPGQEYFVDGMTDELITDLAKVRNIRVISRTSAMHFKKTRKSLAEIARELNVDAVVEGSVVHSGNRVRITAQLIEAAADRHLWADTYERDDADVLAVQAEIARSIAAQVSISLGAGESRILASPSKVNPEVHDAYLKGRYFLNKGSENDIWKAIEQFQLAIAKDAKYAPAYAGLADSYVAFADYYLPPHDTMPNARKAAIQALKLDDQLAEAHSSLAVVRLLYDWDWKGAETEFRRAIELDSNLVDAHVWYANFLAQMDRPKEAKAEIQRAQELDPLSLNVALNASWVFYLARQNDEVTRALKTAVDLDPELQVSHGSAWLGYVPKALNTPAIASLERGEPPKASSPLLLATMAAIDATHGKTKEATRALVQLKTISKTQYVCPYEMAAVHAVLGEKREAFECLEDAYARRSICLPDLKTDPRFDPLRHDARFQELLRRVNFPP
jgi:TolB-like protein/DNA-binding winged helix-turn-helix (wHTH) protein